MKRGPRPSDGLGPAFLVLPWRLEVVRGEALDEVMELAASRSCSSLFTAAKSGSPAHRRTSSLASTGASASMAAEMASDGRASMWCCSPVAERMSSVAKNVAPSTRVMLTLSRSAPSASMTSTSRAWVAGRLWSSAFVARATLAASTVPTLMGSTSSLCSRSVSSSERS